MGYVHQSLKANEDSIHNHHPYLVTANSASPFQEQHPKIMSG
jgi:hypothetical protein